MDPYTGLTVISNIARVLPQTLQEGGMEVRVFMPRYGKINERKHRLHEVIRLSGINVTVADEDNPLIIKVASLPIAKIQIYFLDNEDLFHRKQFFYDDDDTFFEDNDIRTLFFQCRSYRVREEQTYRLTDFTPCFFRPGRGSRPRRRRDHD